jgi:hypothetical protein
VRGFVKLKFPRAMYLLVGAVEEIGGDDFDSLKKLVRMNVATLRENIYTYAHGHEDEPRFGQFEFVFAHYFSAFFVCLFVIF